jgi:hypothetical protein
MGLLDDAIREHLELKRSRGADPSEVARLEREALGPVGQPAAPAAGEVDEPVEEYAEEPPAAREPEAEPERGAPAGDWAEDLEADEPLHPSDSVAQPTEQWSVEDEEPEPGREDDVIPADDEPEGEDLLEETPEFLEETPEHDRLWFEQKPPRDFDFGG